MICEPTANIGTGTMDAGDYIERTTRAVKDVDPVSYTHLTLPTSDLV